MPESLYNFEGEALITAINEACISVEDAQACTIETPCMCCKALAKALENRLREAYAAGFRAGEEHESYQYGGG